MSATNFAALAPKQKVVWSRDVWQAARDQMFLNKFTGTGDGAMIQRITELTKTEKGEQVLMQLVADLTDDGVVGDNEREGNEEAMQAYSQIVNIDLISHGVRNKGKLSDQKTVVDFRKYARNRLAYWLANRMDQLAFLTLSGIGYAFKNNGASRVASPFPGLSFAADVLAPTSKRGLMWDGTALAASNTASIALSPSFKRFKSAFIGGVFCRIGLVGPEYVAEHLRHHTDADTDQDEQQNGEILIEVHLEILITVNACYRGRTRAS